MRKILWFIILEIFMFSLIGCSNSIQKDESNENEEINKGVENIDYVENAEFNSGDIEGLYTGELLNGKPEGNGILVTTNTDLKNWSYEGKWKDGLPNGEGVMKWEDGFAYEGEFHDGQVYGTTNVKKNDELIYVGNIKNGKLINLIREKMSIPSNESTQYVHVGKIDFMIPQNWIYEIFDEKQAVISIPEHDNIRIIFTSNKELDLNKDKIREKIKQEYISEFESDYTKYLVNKDVFENDAEEQSIKNYNLHFSFYSDDLIKPITDVYSKSFMLDNTSTTYTITIIQESGLYDYSESIFCMENTLKNQNIINDLKYSIGDVDKYLKGKAKKQKVYLQGVIDELKYDKDMEETEFYIWYKRGKTYYKGEIAVTISNDDMELYNIPQLQEGKTYYFLSEVYKDGSFGVFDEYSIIPCKKLDSLKDVYTKYKKACMKISSKELMRNPKKNKYKMTVYSGEVLQIVDRDYLLEFLLITNDGSIVNVVYDGKGQNKILEGDNVTVYGEYLCNYTYTTVLGANKEVARINAVIIDR